MCVRECECNKRICTVFEGDGLGLITEQRVVDLALLALLDLLNPENVSELSASSGEEVVQEK
jgi:hypothetical protein